MTSRIGKISLFWRINSKFSLDKNIELAMDAWNRRPELKDESPSKLLINPLNENLLDGFENSYKLDVVFSTRMQAQHIQIECK